MINCAYCESKARSMSGIAMHLRAAHPEKWQGSVKASYPDAFDIGTPEPVIRKAKTTKKGKVPAPTKCPFCGHDSKRAQGLAAHLKGAHPDKWKGNMGSTLGLAPSRKWSKDERGKTKRAYTKRASQANSEHLEDPRVFINCCPNCGTELAPYYLAAGAVARRMAAGTLVRI